MTAYELEVLRAVAKDRGRFGWYNIERRLSNVCLEGRGHLLDVLGALVARGLLRCMRTGGRDTYEITDPGRRVLLTAPESSEESDDTQ